MKRKGPAHYPVQVGQVLTTHGGLEARVLRTDTYTVFGDGRCIGPMVLTSHTKYSHTMATPLARLGEHFRLPGQQLSLFA